MNAYFDTGILLKLYTVEPESAMVRAFVVQRSEALPVSGLHLAEAASALRLKQFRGECDAVQVSKVLGLMEEDLDGGVLSRIAVDWDETWRRTRALSDAHAATTGCRTLDSLHVACASLLHMQEFISSDHRQRMLAREIGLNVINPCS